MNYCCATRVRCEWSEGLYACLRQELLVSEGLGAQHAPGGSGSEWRCRVVESKKSESDKQRGTTATMMMAEVRASQSQCVRACVRGSHKSWSCVRASASSGRLPAYLSLFIPPPSHRNSSLPGAK